jgi:subtilisin family serine protease
MTSFSGQLVGKSVTFRRYLSTISIRRIAIALAASALAPSCLAAQVQPNEYAALLQEAGTYGVVRVLVCLDDTISLESIRNSLPSVRAAMAIKAETLRSELGREALAVGYWNNGIGQAGLFVTPAGLKILNTSSNAKSFTRDLTSAYRMRAHDADGSLAAIQTALSKNGYADAEVFLNIDEGEYDIAKDGRTIYRQTSGLGAEIASHFNRLNAAPFAASFRNVDTTRTFGINPVPSFRVRIDQETFFSLREDADVRAIRLVGFNDARPADWSRDALQQAKNNGSAEIIITLRGGELFSPKSGFMSVKAWGAQQAANQRAIDDILSAAGATRTLSPAADYSALGSIHIKLSYDLLSRLYANADRRILSVQLNRVAATASLTNSTVLINMQSAWTAGYLGSGQNILIIDSGVRKDHELFKMNGVTKVSYEACFGTNSGLYHSICPSADGLGDSPLGLAGSGEPFANLATCATLSALTTTDNHNCSHGTHVAGIAAGRMSNSVSPTNLQGVAIGANLVAIQVFSYDTSSPKAGSFNADILAALNATYAATTAGSSNPFTVNMSLGGGSYSSDCPSYDTAVTNTIANLTSQGVPVVVAAGNDSNKNAISWPACVPQTIKVSSVANDSQGTTLAGFANIGVPANFTGPIFLAPGGSSSTTVTSADRASTIATFAMRGTSQATPHLSGVYAAVKAGVPGISVADATAWIATTGSIGVTYTLPAPTGTQSYRRLHIPAL